MLNTLSGVAYQGMTVTAKLSNSLPGMTNKMGPLCPAVYREREDL